MVSIITLRTARSAVRSRSSISISLTGHDRHVVTGALGASDAGGSHSAMSEALYSEQHVGRDGHPARLA